MNLKYQFTAFLLSHTFLLSHSPLCYYAAALKKNLFHLTSQPFLKETTQTQTHMFIISKRMM